jgi:hypothetical protein
MNRLALLSATSMMLGCAAAHAECTPLSSEVVSIGERAARFYTERSLSQAIEDERRRLSASGGTAGPVTRNMECKPFPNLIGADEWRCIGHAKVCTE